MKNVVPTSLRRFTPRHIFTQVQAVCDTRSFLSWVYQVWIQSFPSPRPVAIPRFKSQSALLFTQSWRENRWMLIIFSKNISAVKCKQIAQDLNSGHHVHFYNTTSYTTRDRFRWEKKKISKRGRSFSWLDWELFNIPL